MYFEEKPESEKLVNTEVVVKKNYGLKVLFFLSIILLIVKIIITLTPSDTSENNDTYKQQQDLIKESYKVQKEENTEYETKYDIDLSAIEELKDQIEQ